MNRFCCCCFEQDTRSRSVLCVHYLPDESVKDMINLPFQLTGMQNPEEHYHVAAPPSYGDLQDEKYQPFPPPMSPIFAQLPRKQPSPSEASADDIGGKLSKPAKLRSLGWKCIFSLYSRFYLPFAQ